MFRVASREIRQFRVTRMAAPHAVASHLRGPCVADHPVTLENTVRIGRAGFRCRLCRRKLADASRRQALAGQH